LANIIRFEVPDFSNMVEKAVFNAVQRVGYSLEEQAKKIAPVDSGAYRNNIKFNGRNEVAANKEYSATIEYGMRSRIVTPKAAKALRFVINGQVFYRKKVKLKERKPNPVMRNAARRVQKEVREIFNEEFGRV
jgi:hypothetical protein